MSYIANPGSNANSSGSAVIYQGTDVSLVPYSARVQNLGSSVHPFNAVFATSISATGTFNTGNLIVASGNYVQLTSSGNTAWKVGVHDDGTLYTF